jgi:hypothetical protein
MEPEVDDEPASEEATLIRDDIQRPRPEPAAAEREDETLMPGESDFNDDDATIRKEDGDEDISLDNFIDMDEEDDDK